jgi:gas vesicle protein
MNNQNQTLLIGALMGGLVGAAAVLLSTPYSGAKLRNKILNGLPHESPKSRHAVKPARRKKAPVKAAVHKATNHKVAQPKH